MVDRLVFGSAASIGLGTNSLGDCSVVFSVLKVLIGLQTNGHGC